MAGETVRRRAKTIPTFVGGLIVMLVLAPGLVPVLALADSARWLLSRRHWMGIRLYSFGVVYLMAETIGLLALGATWVATGFGRFRRPLLRWAFSIQQAWAGTLLAAAARIFGLRFDVVGDEDVGPGPIILMVRHASIMDNLLPAVLVSARHHIRFAICLEA